MQNVFQLLIAFVGLQLYTVNAQNLISNPSFEKFSICPDEHGNVAEDVGSWSKATEGTSDYFNTCSSKMGVPNNFNGCQTAAFGSAYAGAYFLAPNNYREYIQGKLTKTLEKGKRYGISFYISLSEKSNYAIGDIGVLLSAKEMNIKSTKVIKRPFVKSEKNNNFNYAEIKKPSFFKDKKGWTEVYTEITASGTENFLIIGNFKDNRDTKTLQAEGTKNASYYYIDMVSVLPIETSSYENLKVDRVYAFKKVHFPVDDYGLDVVSKTDLKSLYKHLKKNPEMFISIHAHTDNDGNLSYNKSLSNKRAKSVANYLIALGVKQSRIQWYGYGENKPAVANKSLVGKQKNRRAEFILSEKRFIPKSRNNYAETLFEDD